MGVRLRCRPPMDRRMPRRCHPWPRATATPGTDAWCGGVIDVGRACELTLSDSAPASEAPAPGRAAPSALSCSRNMPIMRSSSRPAGRRMQRRVRQSSFPLARLAPRVAALLAAFALILLSWPGAGAGAADETSDPRRTTVPPPADGLRANVPQTYALVGADVVVRPDEML